MMSMHKELVEVVLKLPHENVTDKYIMGRELGRGQFGITYLATDKVTGKEYACKTISKRRIRSPEDVANIKREVAILDLLSGHPSIVEFQGAYEDKNAVHMVMELCTGGELYDRIVSMGHYTEKDASKLLGVIVSVVQACHSHNVMHRDLKPENFLLSSSDKHAPLKATDFGLSVLFRPGEKFTKLAGTPFYMAPEVLTHQYGPQSDVWSAGVILYILLCGVPPFWGESEEEIFYAIKHARLNLEAGPWVSVSNEAKDLVRAMLTRNPEARISPQEILDHPWVCKDGVASEMPLDGTVLKRLRRFAASHKFKKIALNFVAHNLSEEEILGLRSLFESMDVDNSGTITLDELKRGLESRGTSLQQSELMRILESADLDEDGTINYTEFIAATMHLHHLERNDRILNAFRHFDGDGSGFITVDEMRKVLEEHKVPVTDAQLKQMIKEMDSDADGRINYQEFAVMMVRQVTLATGRSVPAGSDDSGYRRSRVHHLPIFRRGTGA